MTYLLQTIAGNQIARQFLCFCVRPLRFRLTRRPRQRRF